MDKCTVWIITSHVSAVVHKPGQKQNFLKLWIFTILSFSQSENTQPKILLFLQKSKNKASRSHSSTAKSAFTSSHNFTTYNLMKTNYNLDSTTMFQEVSKQSNQGHSSNHRPHRLQPICLLQAGENARWKKKGDTALTSIRKSPVLRPACHATPPSSTDSKYCRAGKAGVGVNSSMGVSAEIHNKSFEYRSFSLS